MKQTPDPGDQQFLTNEWSISTFITLNQAEEMKGGNRRCSVKLDYFTRKIVSGRNRTLSEQLLHLVQKFVLQRIYETRTVASDFRPHCVADQTNDRSSPEVLDNDIEK